MNTASNLPTSAASRIPDQSLANQAAYNARWARIKDCVALRQPDRMPVCLFTTFWLAKYGGISIKENMYDYDKVAQIAERVCLEFQPDMVSPVMENAAVGRILDATDFKQLQWPGHGVGDHQPYQYLDREYMTAAEYDDFLLDPTGFYLSTYLPRIAGIYNGLQPLAALSSTMYLGASVATLMFALPGVRQALEHLNDAGQVSLDYVRRSAELSNNLKSLGYPYGFGAITMSPYDVVADFMRGAKGMMTDLYRHRDKLEEVFDKVNKLMLRQIIPQAKASGNPLVFIPLHWAADAFISQKQFEQLWWPSFRAMMMALIAEDLIPVPMWEADCTKRLETIKDIPAGKCIYWFERTDMVRAFEVLGDVVALRGNVSTSALTVGSPADVDADVKRLVDNVWNKGGKLILDTAFGIPDEAPIENVRAMFEAARKYAG